MPSRTFKIYVIFSLSLAIIFWLYSYAQPFDKASTWLVCVTLAATIQIIIALLIGFVFFVRKIRSQALSHLQGTLVTLVFLLGCILRRGMAAGGALTKPNQLTIADKFKAFLWR